MGYKTSIFRHPEGGDPIFVLGEYRPWGYHKDCGGTGSDYPEHSGRILDVKFMRPRGFPYFDKGLLALVARFKVDGLAYVPSSDPAKARTGIRLVLERVAGQATIDGGFGVLVRSEEVVKLATGGDRSMKVHLESISVGDAARVKGKTILLVDDVLTTGNSLVACRRILTASGAAAVHAAALGKTTY